MSIANKLQMIAENEQKVYNAGYNKGKADGRQAEYDRFWDNYQQNGNRNDYKNAFSGTGWTEETLKPKYPVKIVDTTTTSRCAMEMFRRLGYNNSNILFDMTEICKRLDLSEALSIQGLLYNACAKNITLDASKSKTLQEAFRCGDGGVLDNMTLTVSSACQNYTNAFYYCSNLTNLTFTDGSQIAASVDLHWSPLTRASLESVIAALSDTATGFTASLKQSAVNAAFSWEEWLALVAAKPNWTITLA